MKKNLLKIGLVLFLVLIVVFPLDTFAQNEYVQAFCRDNPNAEQCRSSSPAAGSSACSISTGVGGVICKIGGLLSSVLPVLIGLGVVYFIWGVVQYVIGGGEEAKKKGRDTMVFGIIGFAVIIGVWGLVKILTDTFGLSEGSTPTPRFQNLLPK